jgi:hypothetical protein
MDRIEASAVYADVHGDIIPFSDAGFTLTGIAIVSIPLGNEFR